MKGKENWIHLLLLKLYYAYSTPLKQSNLMNYLYSNIIIWGIHVDNTKINGRYSVEDTKKHHVHIYFIQATISEQKVNPEDAKGHTVAEIQG